MAIIKQYDECSGITYAYESQEYRSVLLRPKFHLTEEIVCDIIVELVFHAFEISEEHLDKEKRIVNVYTVC